MKEINLEDIFLKILDNMISGHKIIIPDVQIYCIAKHKQQ